MPSSVMSRPAPSDRPVTRTENVTRPAGSPATRDSASRAATAGRGSSRARVRGDVGEEEKLAMSMMFARHGPRHQPTNPPPGAAENPTRRRSPALGLPSRALEGHVAAALVGGEDPV